MRKFMKFYSDGGINGFAIRWLEGGIQPSPERVAANKGLQARSYATYEAEQRKKNGGSN